MEERVGRGGGFNRSSVAALASAGVRFAAGAALSPNLVVNAQGNLGVLSNRVAVRLRAPRVASQFRALDARIRFGEPRFGAPTVFVVFTPDPLGLEAELKRAAIEVDEDGLEVEVLLPIRPGGSQKAAPSAGGEPDFWATISRPHDTSGSGGTLGIIDAGFEESHPSLKAVWDRRKAVNVSVRNNSIVLQSGIVPDGSSSHGVSVASIAAGMDVGGLSSPGVAEGVSVVPVSMLYVGSPLLFAEAIEYLVKIGVGTVVSSIHFQTVDVYCPVSIPAAAAFAETHKSVITWAALEEKSPRRDHWIGKIRTVVLVAAVDNNLVRQDGTTEVDVVAPGTNLPAAVNNSSYNNVSGHSFATPVVGAAIVLTKLVHPGALASDIRSLIAHSSCSIGAGSPQYGAGVVNVERILTVGGGPLPRCPV